MKKDDLAIFSKRKKQLGFKKDSEFIIHMTTKTAFNEKLIAKAATLNLDEATRSELVVVASQTKRLGNNLNQLTRESYSNLVELDDQTKEEIEALKNQIQTLITSFQKIEAALK